MDRSRRRRRRCRRGEWDYYRAAMASENGMLAIRLGGRGDMTGDQRALEVSQGGAAAAVADRLRQRALHGERRRDRHDAQPGNRRGDGPGAAEGRDRSLLRVAGRRGRQDVHGEREQARSPCFSPAAASSRSWSSRSRTARAGRRTRRTMPEIDAVDRDLVVEALLQLLECDRSAAQRAPRPPRCS